MGHGRLRELEWQRDDLWGRLDDLYRRAVAAWDTPRGGAAIRAYRLGWQDYDRACRELLRAL
jgi:hypothetical protein